MFAFRFVCITYHINICLLFIYINHIKYPTLQIIQTNSPSIRNSPFKKKVKKSMCFPRKFPHLFGFQSVPFKATEHEVKAVSKVQDLVIWMSYPFPDAPNGTGLFTYIWGFPKVVVPPKSSILIGVSIINHSFWDTHILGNPNIFTTKNWSKCRYKEIHTKRAFGFWKMVSFFMMISFGEFWLIRDDFGLTCHLSFHQPFFSESKRLKTSLVIIFAQ